jgi:phytoene synthase
MLKGSEWYYALARATLDKKQALMALDAYAQILNHTAERYHEPSMADIKLNWWHEEIERVFEQQAQHPIAKDLQKAATQFPLNKTALLAMIEGALLSLKTQRFQTQSELAQHYQHTGGILQSLMASVLNEGAIDHATEKYAHTMGIALETIRHIIDTPYYLGRQHLYFPAEVLEQKNIDLSALFNKPQRNAQLIELLKQQADWAQEQYEQALTLLPADQFQIQRPIRLYAMLRFKHLDLIKREGFHVCEHPINVLPLKQWWLSIRFR